MDAHAAAPRQCTPTLLGGVAVGAAVAGVYGLLSAFAFGVMEEIILLGLTLPPLAAALGAACGAVAAKWGWVAAAPAALSLAGGLATGVLVPWGWVVGGVAGGLLSGFINRSFSRAALASVLGATLGSAGWFLSCTYLTWAVEVLNRG